MGPGKSDRWLAELAAQLGSEVAPVGGAARPAA